MMEWLGGTISKEDVGESTKTNKRRKLDDDDEETLGALALRFKYTIVLVLKSYYLHTNAGSSRSSPHLNKW
jgi:hypothetical protein